MDETTSLHVAAEIPEDLEAAIVLARVSSNLLGEKQSPPRVGRFVLQARLGEGGMGVVWAATDPDLDRRIAIKLVREDRPEVRARLLREAQAMARLAHPNVAAVYEVGVHEGRLYLAMELVSGNTLRRWLSEESRSWREILGAYLQAARGLAAAHAVGLVHRDFKPDNVVRGHDGRVRVVDFGLARRDCDSEEREDTLADQSHSDVFASPLTRTGAVMGTPAYMAPEQLAGADVDARSDQFSFCVALWEGLWGKRPFAGTSPAEVFANVRAGRVSPVSRRAGVPRTLSAVLRRGLAMDPADRFASMDALVEALVHDSRRTRARRVSLALFVIVVVALAFAGAHVWRERQTNEECRAQGQAISTTWNEDVRAQLVAGLSSPALSYAQSVADGVQKDLDAYAQAWTEAGTQICLATRLDGAWSEDELDRGHWCLDERRAELAALVGELSRGGPLVLDYARASAAGLTRISPCTDTDYLARLPMPRTEERALVITTRHTLSRAAALQATGNYPEGLAVAREALAEAAALGWPPLVAEARLRVGRLLALDGRPMDAEPELERAYFEAAAVDATEIAATAAESLARTVGDRLGRTEEGLRWSRHAEGWAADLPDPSHLREAMHLDNRALISVRAGDATTALALTKQAHALRLAALTAEHPSTVGGLVAQAGLHMDLGEFVRARDLFAQVAASDERVLGPGHPLVADALRGMAEADFRLGQFDDAERGLRRALDILLAAGGGDQPAIGEVLTSLASIEARRGRLEGARALYERAIPILEKSVGADNPMLARPLDGLGVVLQRMGRLDDAAPLHRRALALVETAHGPSHPHAATPLIHLAEIHQLSGHAQLGVPLLERALAIREAAGTRDHPSVAAAACNLAEVLFEDGQHEPARRRFEQALRIYVRTLGPRHAQNACPLYGLAVLAYEQGDLAGAALLSARVVDLHEVDAGSRGDALFLQARAIDGLGPSQRVPARHLVTRALESLAAASAPAATRDEVTRWLIDHP